MALFDRKVRYKGGEYDMLDFTPTWAFQDEPNEDKVRKFVRECQIDIIEHFSLETEEDGHTLLRPQTTDLEALRRYMQAYSSLHGDGHIQLVQTLMPDRFKNLVLQLFHEWIPFPNFK